MVNYDVLELLLYKPHLTSIMSPALKVPFIAQVQKESDHVQLLSVKTLLRFDANQASLHLLLIVATQTL